MASPAHGRHGYGQLQRAGSRLGKPIAPGDHGADRRDLTGGGRAIANGDDGLAGAVVQRQDVGRVSVVVQGPLV